MKKSLLFAAACSLPLMLAGCVHHLTQAECMSTNWQQVGFTDGSQGLAVRNLQSSIQDCMKFHITVDPELYLKGYKQGLKQYCTPSYELGFEDGTAGKPLSAIMERQEICQNNQIIFDTTRYQLGRSKGLVDFCTYERGQELGATGASAPAVCPPNLQAQFMRGWQSGRDQYCSNAMNGFALGKANQPYPDACSGSRYLAFQSEYQRGQIVAGRIDQLQRRIDRLKGDIDDLANQYGLQRSYGQYTLGSNQSPAAQNALNQVNSMVRERERLRNQLYQAQVTN